MKQEFRLSLFIFRRDLRLQDNTALISALKCSEKVLPIFIFTPEQAEKNPFKSDFCFQFMLESLEDLQNQLQKKRGLLYLFRGKSDEIVEKLLSKLPIEALFINHDYTPYSIKRDEILRKVCKTRKVSFFSYDDILLNPPEKTLKKDGKPYLIFTPFFQNAAKQKVPTPSLNEKTNYFQEPISFAEEKSFLSTLAAKQKKKGSLPGGRKEAIRIIKKLASFKDYETLRNFPHKDYSTHLSPYLKFSVISPREIFHAISSKLSSSHPLIRSLYWRDFFTSIAFFFPHVFKGAFHPKFDKLQWSNNKQDFARWCEGRTGFPLVDAGMREMNQTGFMHNRLRMITASFLIKDLHIDWRWGERYFAQTLIDYDPSVNNGNWQWVASTGCDGQPYFRIFNPWSQQVKFDPECLYIKKWVPELKSLPKETIHNWVKEKAPSKTGYPIPILEHPIEAKKALASYKKLS